jgi:hypothetical protein
MPFTSQELDNIANAAIDYHFQKGKIYSQTIQDRPLLKAMMDVAKEFPSGKDNITVRVKGLYSTSLQGYTADDTVTYVNPANIKTAVFPWKETHGGIQITLTELKKDGISISDTATGTGEQRHSDREMTALANLLDDKIEDMKEGTERGLNSMFWQDGTQDAKAIPGIRSIILDNPTSGTIVGGLDQVANSWWQNRASLNIVSYGGGTAANQTVVQTLGKEYRQLRRYGGRPTLWLAGSKMIDWIEQELRSKGNYTLEGWTSTKATDAGIADIHFKGNKVLYDPTLDDLGFDKYMYVIDPKSLFPMPMQDEAWKKHNPARPAEKYVLYRAVTWTGGLICRQRNANGVYSLSA